MADKWIPLSESKPPIGSTVLLWDAMFERPDIREIDNHPLDPDYTHWIDFPSKP